MDDGFYYIGQIAILPYDFQPAGWLPCDGEQFSIAQYRSLYNVIGCKFGGDNLNYFCTPNLQGAEAVPGTLYFICCEGATPTT